MTVRCSSTRWSTRSGGLNPARSSKPLTYSLFAEVLNDALLRCTEDRLRSAACRRAALAKRLGDAAPAGSANTNALSGLPSNSQRGRAPPSSINRFYDHQLGATQSGTSRA